MDIFKFKKIKKFLYRSTEVLGLFIAISLLIGLIFGPETPVFGNVLINFSEVMNLFGENGLLALVSLIIIFAILQCFQYLFERGRPGASWGDGRSRYSTDAR